MRRRSLLRWFSFFVLYSQGFPSLANDHLPTTREQIIVELSADFEFYPSEIILKSPFKDRLKKAIEEKKEENPRLVGALLTITLGPFGAHRIYMGTDTKVPVFYTLTLGGGLGVLPVIDLGCILFTKDIEKYYANDQIFMWSTVAD